MRRALPAGFTLIEVLVAISLMALMAVMAWRGIDGLGRSMDQTGLYVDRLVALQTGIDQWRTDLDAMESIADVPALDWDGVVLRILRRDPAGSGRQVVAWSLRQETAGASWLRWSSPSVYDRRQLQAAWQDALRWAHSPDDGLRGREVSITTALGWELRSWSSNGWQTLPTTGNHVRGPSGLKATLRLPQDSPVPGELNLSWVHPLRPGGGP